MYVRKVYLSFILYSIKYVQIKIDFIILISVSGIQFGYGKRNTAVE